MDEVDSGPSWASRKTRNKAWSLEPPKREQQRHHVSTNQSDTSFSSHDQRLYRSSSLTLFTSAGACHAFHDTDSSGTSEAFRSSRTFSHVSNSLHSDFLTQDDFDPVPAPTRSSPEKKERFLSQGADGDPPIICINPAELSLLLKAGLEKYLLIDTRSFLEYNTAHIQHSTNVCCSRLVKRRLQRDKLHIRDLLTQTCHIDVDEFDDIIVYDQCTEDPSLLSDEAFLSVLLQKLAYTFKRVSLIRDKLLKTEKKNTRKTISSKTIIMSKNQSDSPSSTQHVVMYTPVQCFTPPTISNDHPSPTSSQKADSKNYDAQGRLENCLMEHFANTDRQMKIAIYHVLKKENQEAISVLENMRQRQKGKEKEIKFHMQSMKRCNTELQKKLDQVEKSKQQLEWERDMFDDVFADDIHALESPPCKKRLYDDEKCCSSQEDKSKDTVNVEQSDPSSSFGLSHCSAQDDKPGEDAKDEPETSSSFDLFLN